MASGGKAAIERELLVRVRVVWQILYNVIGNPVQGDA